MKKLMRLHRPSTVRVGISTNSPRKLVIVGTDPSKKNTDHFFRQCIVDGTEEFQFGVPKPPRKLKVIVFDVDPNAKDSFKLDYVKSTKLKTAPLLTDPLTRKYLKFAATFCSNCGTYFPKTYRDRDRNFKLEYLPIIKGDKGQELNTPARIHKVTDVIQASKKHMTKMSVPSRFAIMTHEYSHNFMNDDMSSEIEADMHGLKLYLSEGFPYIEAIYAFTSMFSDTNQNLERLHYVYDFLNRHEMHFNQNDFYQAEAAIMSNPSKGILS